MASCSAERHRPATSRFVPLNAAFHLGKAHVGTGNADWNGAIRKRDPRHIAEHVASIGHGKQIDMVAGKAISTREISRGNLRANLLRVQFHEPLDVYAA